VISPLVSAFLPLSALAGSDPEIIHRGPPIGGCRQILGIAGMSVQNPACLPGNKIAVNVMNGYNGSHSEMHIVDPATGTHQKVQTVATATSYTGHITRRTANGRREFIAQCPGDSLCIFDLQGNKCKIANTQDGEEATFSPDGKRAVFDRGGDICVVSVKADIKANKDCWDGFYQCPSIGGQNTQPDWSPLGDKIVFQRRMSGPFRVATMNVQNGLPDWHPVILPGQPEEGTDASFGPDGSIVFSSGPGILWIPSAGGAPAALKGLPRGYNGANVLCGDYVYLEHNSTGLETNTSVWQCDARFER
jgi:hypothetical protein